MLFKEINQKFTEKVAEYIANGYRINAGTMSGSQGEIANIDFTDGKDVYRLLLEKTYVHEYNCLFGGNVIKLIIGRSTEKEGADSLSYCTVWNDKLEIIEEQDFYEVGMRRDGSIFYGTKEEAEASAEVRHERYENAPHRIYSTNCQNITSEKTVDAVIPFVKKMCGGKRVNRSQIEVRKYTDRTGYRWYQVEYFSHSWKLA